jgi:DNA polymerase-4
VKGEGAESAILFAEVPNFYAEVERRAALDLRGCPILVGGDPGKRGRVQSASAEAREAGVTHGMGMAAALEVCPRAARFPTNMKRYREVSGALVTCFRGIFDEVETAGLGSVYADVHGGAQTGEQVAEEWLRRVGAELGLPFRAGIAPSKFLARLAAEEASIGAVYRLGRADTGVFLGPLSVSRLPRVGDKTAARLRKIGVETVSDVLALGASTLEAELGNHGLAILEMARGQDRSPMRVAGQPQSIGRKTTFAEPSADPEKLSDALSQLAASLGATLERQGLRASRVALRLLAPDGVTTTRSTTLEDPIAQGQAIYRVGRGLLDRDGGSRQLQRGLGITLAGLKRIGAEERQLDLFAQRGRDEPG